MHSQSYKGWSGASIDASGAVRDTTTHAPPRQPTLIVLTTADPWCWEPRTLNLLVATVAAGVLCSTFVAAGRCLSSIVIMVEFAPGTRHCVSTRFLSVGQMRDHRDALFGPGVVCEVGCVTAALLQDRGRVQVICPGPERSKSRFSARCKPTPAGRWKGAIPLIDRLERALDSGVDPDIFERAASARS
jgi:hypothetical protein